MSEILEPKWVLENTVIAMHDRQITEFGGASGVRDMGLLQSALARPQRGPIWPTRKQGHDLRGLRDRQSEDPVSQTLHPNPLPTNRFLQSEWRAKYLQPWKNMVLAHLKTG